MNRMKLFSWAKRAADGSCRCTVSVALLCALVLPFLRASSASTLPPEGGDETRSVPSWRTCDEAERLLASARVEPAWKLISAYLPVRRWDAKGRVLSLLAVDALERMGRPARAAAVLRSLLRHVPRGWYRLQECRLTLARLHVAAGEKRKAVDVLLEVASHPLCSRYSRRAFRSLRELLGGGAWKELLREPETLLKWASILSRFRARKEALDILYWVGECGDFPLRVRAEAALHRVRVLAALRRFESARWICDEWIRRLSRTGSSVSGAAALSRTLVSLRFERASCLRKLRRFDEVLGIYRGLAASEGPAVKARALHEKGCLHLEQGERAKALEAFLEAASTGVSGGWFSGSAAWKAALLSYEAGRYRRALQLFRSCSLRGGRILPDSVCFEFMCLLRMGRESEAKKRFEFLVGEYPLSLAAVVAWYKTFRGIGRTFSFRARREYYPLLAARCGVTRPSPPVPRPWTWFGERLASPRPSLKEAVACGRLSYVVEELYDEFSRTHSLFSRLGLGWALYGLGRIREGIQMAEMLLNDQAAFKELEASARREILRLAWPPAHLPVFKRWCREYGVGVPLTLAVAREESRFRADDLSWADAMGIMQIIPSTSSWLASRLGLRKGFDPVESMTDPALNIRFGVYYLSRLETRLSKALHGDDALEENLELWIMGAYNGGPGAMLRNIRTRWNGDLLLFVHSIRAQETRHYIRKVAAALMAYEILYDWGRKRKGI